VAGHGFDALGVCAAVDCERVFANPAERRPRRFCTPKCSSRTRVAAYRARRGWPLNQQMRNQFRW